MNPTQLNLPKIRDWTEVQAVACGELGPVIVQAAVDGFQAIRLDVIPTGGYRLTFQRASETKLEPKRFASFIHRSQPPEPPEHA